jgi:phosphatidylserine/phosphatidylglycerophosphate/cardiolipin synthase-like enzyme
MRISRTDGPLTARAVAGTHVVQIGIDHDRAAMAGVRGFGIERVDHTSGTRRWLTNHLRFDDVGNEWGTNFNPLQTFTWGDYAVESDRIYTYVVHALEGRPGSELTPRHTVSLQVHAERPDVHGVWFNRGVIASQAYARRFQNKPPGEVPNRAAWKWLSRGLEEALLGFIGQAVDENWSLHGAMYEFRHPSVMEALRVAASVGARVRLVVDGKPEDGKENRNRALVTAAGIDDLVETWRTKAQIAHNKFLVLSHLGQPLQVWTGSTNITENGIFGQSNVGHVVKDAGIAAAYRAYWQQLTTNPTPGELNNWVDANNQLADPWEPGSAVIFSPRTHFTALDRYAASFKSAAKLVCATFPFTLDSAFADQLGIAHPGVRLLLFEDMGKARAAQALVKDDATTIAAGSFRPADSLSGLWRGELKNPLSQNVEYVHTKYLLVDPLGDDPLVISGSANFSKTSTNRNDENMLVIRGDRRLADIYFTEFFRLFSHYRLRSHLQLEPDQPAPGPGSPVHVDQGLDPTDAWWPRYFDEPGRSLHRRLLAGTD